MAVKEKVECLYIKQQDICEHIKNGDSKTRLEYIYKYTTENSWDNFLIYATRRKAQKEDIEDIFQESVIDIYIRIEAKHDFLKCKFISKKCSKFLGYFWRILYYKLMDLFKESKTSENGANPQNDNYDLCKIIKYVYYEILSENDKRHFKMYFEDELTHDEVVALNVGITTNLSSRNSKNHLRNKLKLEGLKALNNEKLLDYIRDKYKCDDESL